MLLGYHACGMPDQHAVSAQVLQQMLEEVGVHSYAGGRTVPTQMLQAEDPNGGHPPRADTEGEDGIFRQGAGVCDPSQRTLVLSCADVRPVHPTEASEQQALVSKLPILQHDVLLWLQMPGVQ